MTIKIGSERYMYTKYSGSGQEERAFIQILIRYKVPFIQSFHKRKYYHESNHIWPKCPTVIVSPINMQQPYYVASSTWYRGYQICRKCTFLEQLLLLGCHLIDEVIMLFSGTLAYQMEMLTTDKQDVWETYIDVLTLCHFSFLLGELKSVFMEGDTIIL